MKGDHHQPLCVLVFSSGNPAATLLAAGLLHGQPDSVGAVLIQGVEDATPAPEVARVLAQVGLDLGDWVPQVVSGPPAEPVDVGLTVCVPTCET